MAEAQWLLEDTHYQAAVCLNPSSENDYSQCLVVKIGKVFVMAENKPKDTGKWAKGSQSEQVKTSKIEQTAIKLRYPIPITHKLRVTFVIYKLPFLDKGGVMLIFHSN